MSKSFALRFESFIIEFKKFTTPIFILLSFSKKCMGIIVVYFIFVITNKTIVNDLKNTEVKLFNTSHFLDANVS